MISVPGHWSEFAGTGTLQHQGTILTYISSLEGTGKYPVTRGFIIGARNTQQNRKGNDDEVRQHDRAGQTFLTVPPLLCQENRSYVMNRESSLPPILLPSGCEFPSPATRSFHFHTGLVEDQVTVLSPF